MMRLLLYPLMFNIAYLQLSFIFLLSFNGKADFLVPSLIVLYLIFLLPLFSVWYSY